MKIRAAPRALTHLSLFSREKTMFGKEKDGADQAGPGAASNVSDKRKPEGQSSAAPSIISADMKVVGNLQSGGDVQIEGSVEGDIKSRTVTIGEKAQINGSVIA
ncbi:MAG: polymer-forming cytoskeletal protein, partial [Proteobacteria bacterium]|nr:polymer-forming cytoskeletal protein [Pseudomonadota bacterium]